MDLMTRRRAIMGMPSGKDYTVTGNVVSISNALAKNAKSLIVSFSPKQNGSGDPSPSNVRPISGYNDIGAVRYGKNLFDLSKSNEKKKNGATLFSLVYGTDSVTMQTSTTASLYVIWGLFQISASMVGSKVTRSQTVSGGVVRFVFSATSDFASTTDYSSATYTIQASDVGKYMGLWWLNNTGSNKTLSNVQVEFSASATSYEPYISPVTANVHSDTTLFGGTVDLVSGECVVDRMLTTVSQLSWTKYSVTQGNLFRAGITNINASLNNPPSMSDQYKFVASASRTDKTLSRATSSAVDIIDNDYSDAASFKSAKGSVQICYPLANPITYQLTPSQLALLKGNNTVYSNEGSITLTYVGK